jgi:hypothetical protein
VSLRAIGVPRPVGVETGGGGGGPAVVVLDGRRHAVTAVRDDWLVQDLWWTGRPVDRRYYELVLDSGRLATVFRDATDGSWHAHGGRGAPPGPARPPPTRAGQLPVMKPVAFTTSSTCFIVARPLSAASGSDGRRPGTIIRAQAACRASTASTCEATRM